MDLDQIGWRIIHEQKLASGRPTGAGRLAGPCNYTGLAQLTEAMGFNFA